jgi:hypothetical protein
MRAVRQTMLEVWRLGLIAALFAVVSGLWQEPEPFLWDAILSFCIHVLAAMAILVPLFGGVLIYRRIRQRRLLARIRREFQAATDT